MERSNHSDLSFFFDSDENPLVPLRLDLEVRSEGPGDGGREHERGFFWEEDSRHRDVLLEEWGLVSCNGVSTPVTTTEQCEENKVDMQDFDATTFRRSAARLNYLAQDRPDIAFAANFLARSMAHPRVGDDVRMKRVIR